VTEDDGQNQSVEHFSSINEVTCVGVEKLGR